MRVSIGAIHGGMGFTPYPIIQQPSTDPAVFVQDPGYIYRLNLQAAQQQANRINQDLQNSGCPTIGVDSSVFQQWWNSFSEGPGVGDPPPGPEPYWTGVDATRSDPRCAQFTYFVGGMGPSTLSLPGAVLNNSLTVGVPSDLVGVRIGGPNCDPSNPASCFGGGVVPAQTRVPVQAQGSSRTSAAIPPASAASTQPTVQQMNAATTDTTGTKAPPASAPASNFLTDSTILNSVPNWAVVGGGIVGLVLVMQMLGKH